MHVHVFVLEGTQLGWEQQPTFYQRMGKSVISAQMELFLSSPRSTKGKKNNSILHLDHTSLQSAFTDGISFEPGHSQR